MTTMQKIKDIEDEVRQYRALAEHPSPSHALLCPLLHTAPLWLITIACADGENAEEQGYYGTSRHAEGQLTAFALRAGAACTLAACIVLSHGSCSCAFVYPYKPVCHTDQAKLAKLRRELLEPGTGSGGGGKGEGVQLQLQLLSMLTAASAET